ncbi:unnamed protein product, partial [Adineta steineri]
AFDQCTKIIDLSQNLSSNSLFEYSLNNKLDSLTNIRIIFKVILNCSNDNNAWQKGQLYRQSTEQVLNDDQSHYL